MLYSSNGTDWTEAHDVSNNTSWANSSLISNSSYGSGSEFNASTVSNDFIGRYFRLVVNKITGPYNHVKIGELQIQGVMHTLETVSDNNPTPVLATATASDNTTTVTDSTVTSTTHLNNDTTTTTTTETRIVIAANTETTTTKKTNVQIVTTATPHLGLTATPSNTVTTHSDNTVTTTTYATNDTTTRTLVIKTVDISANTNTSTNYNTIITKIIQAFAVSTGSASSFNPNKMFDASGVACPALKSIYEQLMNVPGRAQIMQSRDFTSSPMPSVSTITGGFPFIPGDKLVMYIRPKIQFAQATFPEQFTNLLGFGGVTFGEPVVDTALASGGAITGQTYTESSKYSDTYAGSKLFDGSTTTFWITASNTYGSDGVATGGSTTIHADDGGGTYAGHYVQVEFANSVAIEDIKITPRNLGGGGAGEPKEFRILSSDDGSTFRVAYSVAEGDLNNDWSLWSTQTFHLSNLRDASSKGKYWRIAVGKITTGNKVQLAKVELIGNLSSTLIDNTVGNPVVASAGPDLASQVLYENFEDNAYTGDVTTATIVSGGYNSSNYALQSGGKNNYNRWKLNSMTYQSVSFWYYRDSANSGSNYESIFDNCRQTNGTNLLFFKNQTGHAHKDKINFTSLNSAVTKLYINGVDQSSAITSNWEANFTPITYADLTWHHFYLEFNTTYNHPATFGDADDGGSGYAGQYAQWGAGGKFDEVRFFNAAVAESKILDLAAGNNGNGGAGGEPWTSSTLTNGYPTTGSILDISGLETNITKLSSTFPALFPGNTTGGNEAEPEKFGWVGSANADTLSLETTDETDTRTMDLHVWKITITL